MASPTVMVLIELFASQFDHLAVLAGTLSRKAPHKDLCRHPKVFLDSTTIANSSSTTRCPSMCLTSRRIYIDVFQNRSTQEWYTFTLDNE